MAASSLGLGAGGLSEGITSTSHQDAAPAPGIASINTGASKVVQDEQSQSQPQPESAVRRIFRNVAGVYRVSPQGSSSSSALPAMIPASASASAPGSSSPSAASISLTPWQSAAFGNVTAESQYERRLAARNKVSYIDYLVWAGRALC